MYNEYKVYGPYTRKDGRQHVVLLHLYTKERITVSYPKFLIEQHLGRYLEESETVDHIDRDFTNNSISNLQVLKREEHAKVDVTRLKELTFTCPYCSKDFVLDGQKLSRAISNNKKGKAGPFCSKSCAGKYGADIQKGKINKVEHVAIVPEYTKAIKTPL